MHVMNEQVNARYSGSAFLSLFLHACVVAVIFFFTYMMHDQIAQSARVIELVAGPGDNFAATDAPALGTPDSKEKTVAEATVAPVVKFVEPAPAIPVAPAPPVQPLESVASPVEPVAVPVPTAVPIPKVEKKTPAVVPSPKPVDISRMIRNKVVRADSQAKREMAKEKAAEQKRISKEQFDALNKKTAAAMAATSTQKIAHVDGEGIKNGVVAGSTSNKTGGAGGKALSREDSSLMDGYFSMFKERVRAGFEKPADVSDSLVVHIIVWMDAKGTISRARVDHSSGNSAFDDAVLASVSAVRMPARPDGKSEDVGLSFRAKEQDGG